MAISYAATCPDCGKTHMVMTSGTYTSTLDRCYDCESTVNTTLREKHFIAKEKLTLEERIRAIEEWIYDYKPYVDHTRTPIGGGASLGIMFAGNEIPPSGPADHQLKETDQPADFSRDLQM